MITPILYWEGASGETYGYWLHALPFSCAASLKGNYIFTKFMNDRWYAVYIGQGGIDERINDKSHYDCAIMKGATHVYVHTKSFEADRNREVMDLINNHDECLEPTGCNLRHFD